MTIIYEHTDAFNHDFKRLLKKFRSLKEDFQTAQQHTIELFHIQKIDNNSIFEIPNISKNNIKIYKVRKFACKALKGSGVKSGIRIIYAYHLTAKKITYLEIYFKGNKENENRERINEYLP